MIDKKYKRVNKCLCQNCEGLSEKLEKLGYRRRGKPGASGIIVYPETNEYEELPYSEIEWKEGWMDYYCCQDRFLERASEEYYDPEFRGGIDRFSVVSPYWTDLNYSEDPEDWEEDLREHLDSKWKDKGDFFSEMMNPGDKFIGFGLECNSVEEMGILSRYFFDNGFVRQLRGIDLFEGTKKSRVWFTPTPDGPYPEDDIKDGGPNLYLYDIRCSDYPRLREAILGLWEIGFLFKYQKNCYY